MNLYTYAEGNLLEKPNTYFYTKFSGREFLDAWKSDRERVYSTLGIELPALNGSPNLLRSLFSKIESGDVLDVYFVFDAVFGAIVDSNKSDMTKLKKIINMLVKRFELGKRWYSKYDASFRALDINEYGHLELYVLGAEVFDKAYGLCGDLPYLNALLKSIDILCSVHRKLNAEQKGRLARLISIESKYVNSFI